MTTDFTKLAIDTFKSEEAYKAEQKRLRLEQIHNAEIAKFRSDLALLLGMHDWDPDKFGDIETTHYWSSPAEVRTQKLHDVYLVNSVMAFHISKTSYPAQQLIGLIFRCPHCGEWDQMGNVGSVQTLGSLLSKDIKCGNCCTVYDYEGKVLGQTYKSVKIEALFQEYGAPPVWEISKEEPNDIQGA
jgi:hypothetical protein